ncbi:two-component system histidine kinase PnpS [Tepidibacillus fermentans]|uniref:histidine kinase n=1 Tax=Tepidibacillus fermentans TaxID=1281767 RepID=A0A4R3KJ44_9BACI|nr:ATP-binding protein [Tepidibacillus fermentans]TCS83566.1 two-component system phosphate regulon sensor histidine kinase PhoR [Tepidibacillus fermentans]
MNKLKTRLTLTYIILIGIFVVGLGIFLTKLIEDTYIDAIGDRLTKESTLLGEEISWAMNFAETTALRKDATRIKEKLNARVTMIDIHGYVLAESDFDQKKMENHASRPEFKQALAGGVGKEIRYSRTLGMEMLYIASPVYYEKHLVGAIRLAIPFQEIKNSINYFWYSLVFSLTIVFLITIFISNQVATKITRPIEHITYIAKRITNRDYHARVQVHSKDEIGQLAAVINLMADSLQNQIEMIHENQSKLSTVLNNMTSGIILVDRKGKIILANPALEWLLGVKVEELVGKYHMEVGHNYLLSELIERSLNTGESIRTEIDTYYPTKKSLDSSLAPIHDAKGEINGVVAVLHDITKLKNLENMRKEFVANVSHELRTPITAVRGFAETLLDGAMKDEEICKSFLQIIYKESDRLHRLIHDLLDLSKIEFNQDLLKYTLVDLKPFIESTIEMVRPEALKKELTIIEELNPIQAEVDEDRIRQVVINLLTNAIAYTPPKGTITIRLYEDSEEIFTIEVEDTGIGIPKKSLPRIFERFYRVDKARSRESGGTGLGLAIVKHIVESHSGNIRVESEVQKGTKFSILLPKKRFKV